MPSTSHRACESVVPDVSVDDAASRAPIGRSTRVRLPGVWRVIVGGNVGFLSAARSPRGVAPERRFARFVVTGRAVQRVRVAGRLVVPFLTLGLFGEAL
jgi:hypothetical protein